MIEVIFANFERENFLSVISYNTAKRTEEMHKSLA
jgi:hypothetical protein